MKSIFIDKNSRPTVQDLAFALGDTFPIWNNFEAFTKENYPKALTEWNFSGEKYGWNYRIKDPKRVLIYLLPRNKYFKTAFVFGQKVTDKILESGISEFIKTELRSAKPYAEGRGIRIEVKDLSNFEDIRKLIRFKILG